MTYNFCVRDFVVGFCLKLLNSTVVIGLYYGVLTTASIGPSYLFLIRARVMEKGSETEIAATTGFITGRLMMFISIYYGPLHLALNRPHTLTFLTLPYLLFNYVHKNDKHYYSGGWEWESNLDSGYKNPNSIRNFRTCKVFFNNLFFQLLNPLLLPSSILIRLMHIYLFRSNNKLLFLTSSFVGWLIGHIFLMKCIGLVLVWLKKKNSIKSKITMRFDKYILLQLRNYMGQIFVVLAFAIFVHYLGRVPLPYFFFSEEMIDYDERDLDEIQAAIDAETKETNEEDITVYLSENEKTSNNMNIQKKKKIVPFERSLVTTLFDYQRWTRPLRYIENDYFDKVVRDENSQFFFQTCESDGKKRISFTYPPHLSSFQKIMEKKMDLFKRDKTSYNDNELYNSWISINKEKKNQLSNELFQRAKILDKKGKKFNPVDVFENRIRLSDDRRKKKCLPKIYDPFLNGRARGESQKSVPPFIRNKTDTTKSILINKIHGLLLCIDSNSAELEQKIDKFDRKLLFTEMGFFFNLISKFSKKSVSSLNFDELYLLPEHEQVKIYSEEKKRKRNFLFDAIRTNPKNNTFFNRKLCSEINEISKEVPRWSYHLIDDLEVVMNQATRDPHIRCEYAERVVIMNTQTQAMGMGIAGNNNKNEPVEPAHELVLPAFTREPDFNRELITGSVRPQRRKIAILKLWQGYGHIHSPLFLEIIDQYPFGDIFNDISQYWKEYFRKPGTDNSEFLRYQKALKEKEKEDAKDRDEDRRIRVEQDWETILYGLIIRSFVLLFQSMFRKYILLPALIITKNIIRILLFQNPEWSEDFRDWRREIHLKCNYPGMPTPNNTLPLDWISYGIQIKILFPFVLKPWHNKPKVRSTEKKKRSTEKRYTEKRSQNSWFLTAYGTMVERPFENHVPNPFSFLGPILKQITKQLKKDLKNRFRKFYNEREKKRKKEDRILLEELKEIENKNGKLKKEELIEIIKNLPISKSNPMIEESPEKRIKDLNVKTKTILKEIEKMTEEKKDGVITDAKRLELLKNSLKIVQRRNVRLIRKSYCFLKIFMERLYIHILTTNYVEDFLTSSIVQRYLSSIVQRYLNFIKLTRYLFELTKKIVNESIYNKKKNEQSVDKTNKSIIPFMSIIDKPWNITDMNSQNSCDVSSLSQAYVLFKLSQLQVSHGYKYKLRSIFESLRHKNRPDSIMNQWTNWLKVSNIQYALPQSAWSRLVPQKWRNRIHEHRVAQNNDLLEYDSSKKTLFIFSKKQNVELLKKKKKIKKQYGYDLFSYQYLNYADKKKSYIYGDKPPSYNIPKNIKELFDIMGDSFIQNYIGEDGILDEKKRPRKYFHWMGMAGKRRTGRRRNGKRRMGMNRKRKKNSITNEKLLTPTFGFFSKISAYKKNPWILPIKFFFASQQYQELYNSEYKHHSRKRYLFNLKYRTNLIGERNFLLDRYLVSHIDCNDMEHYESALAMNMNLIPVMNQIKQLKQLKKFLISSIKKDELDLESLIRSVIKGPSYGYCRDTKEMREKLIFSIEPNRFSIKKNYEQLFIYQTISISLKHKRKISKRNKDKNHYDLLIPENLLSTRRRRELRILICLNPRNRKTMDRNTINEKEIKNSSEVLTKTKDLDSDTKKLMNLKFFLWPNYRFEDLACMNRYWFDTHNGSRFSILRIRMYPRLKI
uniref:Protein TIC 214 n=1 Tax=Lathyrus graminifolius TaxID=457904 RepID=A0A0F6NE11_LATPG|nr:hypothetical chloroplast RF19 [Lathyrus graminifolius]AIK20723.1 hypothetical chloroplast RF19 [Lathyrus graminifolius]